MVCRSPRITPRSPSLDLNTGKVLVYDYTAGNGLGTGASLSGLRQTAAILGTGANYSAGTQQGTAWKDDNTVLAFAGEGKLYTVDATSMANYEREDRFPYDGHSEFDRSVRIIQMFRHMCLRRTVRLLRPAASRPTSCSYLTLRAAYAELTPAGGIDFSTSAFAIRDIALDASGNLFVSTAGSSAAGQGRIEYIPGVTTTLGSTTANSSVDWYLDEVFGGVQSGLDIGFAPPAGVAGDYNNDGKVNASDYVHLEKVTGHLRWQSCWLQLLGEPTSALVASVLDRFGWRSGA